MLQKAFGCLFLFVLVPVGMGLLWTGGSGKEKRRPAQLYLAGFLMELAAFQLVAVPVMIWEVYGMQLLVQSMNVLLAVLSVGGAALFCYKRKKEQYNVCALENCGSKSVEYGIYWGIALATIGFQTYMSFAYASFDGDDAYYVVQSVLADQTGVLNRILPYTGLSTSLDVRHALATLPLWVAYVARLTGIHATIVAHTLLPLVFIPMTYLSYYEIGRKLLGAKNTKLPIFMTLVSVMQIWGNTSIYTNATFFLTRTWQGKSVMANLVLLVQLWVLLEIFDGEKKAAFWKLLVVTNIVAAMMTSMGAFLSALLIGTVGLVAAVRTKKISILPRLALCCIPNVIYLLMLLVL